MRNKRIVRKKQRQQRSPVTLASLALCLGFLLPIGAWASGHYNLGAFWRAPVSTASAGCTQVIPAMVQTVASLDVSPPTLPSATLTQTAGNTLILAGFFTNPSSSLSLTDTLGNTWNLFYTQKNSNS